MEINLAQINAIRCRSIIMQMNTSAQRLFMSLQRIFFLVPEQHQHLLQIRQQKGPLTPSWRLLGGQMLWYLANSVANRLFQSLLRTWKTLDITYCNHGIHYMGDVLT
jgi:hypothetical protein